MKIETIDEMVSSQSKTVDFEELQSLFQQKLDLLCEQDGSVALLDYENIRHSAQIELLCELMPSLRKTIEERLSSEIVQ